MGYQLRVSTKLGDILAKAKKKPIKNSYWKDVAIRAVRTAVQVFAGVLMANQAGMF